MGTIIGCLVISLFIFVAIRVQVAYWNGSMIDEGIRRYRMFILLEVCRHGDLEEPQVHYDDAESMWKTAIRIFDFGYKKILPQDKLALIEPYIEEIKYERRSGKKQKRIH